LQASSQTTQRYFKYLAKTDNDNVSILPDLKRKQRLEESGMDEEVARRNEEVLMEECTMPETCAGRWWVKKTKE
jgi:hypothetical protein